MNSWNASSKTSGSIILTLSWIADKNSSDLSNELPRSTPFR
jgi:hypothetical protein